MAVRGGVQLLLCRCELGREGKATEGKGRERNGREGKGRGRKGREGNGTERKGRERNGTEGNGRERNGREGKGRERNGTEGKGTERNGTEGDGTERNGTERKGTERCELDVTFFFSLSLAAREARWGGPSVAVRGGVQLGGVARRDRCDFSGPSPVERGAGG